MACIRGGETGRAAQRWLDNAAIAHLLDWRIKEYLSVHLDPDDRELPGGAEATQWVFDRFWHVYPEDWEPTSVLWELAYYLAQPSEVAECAGVSRQVLDERVLSTQSLTKAASRRVWQGGTPDRVDGQTRSEMLETVIGHLEAGATEHAVVLARRWADVRPADEHAQLVLAFCLIPHEILEARQRLVWLGEQLVMKPENPDGERRLLSVLVRVNLVACALVAGEAADNELLRDLMWEMGDEHSSVMDEAAYLWRPWNSSSPLAYLTIREWIGEAQASGAPQDRRRRSDRQDQM